MKKVILIVILILVIASVIGILFRNKARNQMKITKSIDLTSIPVTVTNVGIQKIDETLTLVGTLYGNTEVSILSETQGKVIAVKVNIGDKVSKGSLLVKIDDEMKQASLLSAQANYENAKIDYERYKKLNEVKSVNDAQLEQAGQALKLTESQFIIARRQLNDTKIVAPISGVITSRLVEIGSVVNNGTPIVNIVDISTLKLKVNVPENDVFKLKVGQEVDLKTEVYQGIIFKGKIKSISDKSDDSHTYPIEVTLPNSKEYPLKSGMFARVSLKTESKDDAVVITRNALVGSVRNPQVFVIEKNIARLKNVRIGGESGDYLEVTSGLSAGEVVVTSGQINLKDSAHVSISD